MNELVKLFYGYLIEKELYPGTCEIKSGVILMLTVHISLVRRALLRVCNVNAFLLQSIWSDKVKNRSCAINDKDISVLIGSDPLDEDHLLLLPSWMSYQSSTFLYRIHHDFVAVKSKISYSVFYIATEYLKLPQSPLVFVEL